MRRFGWLWLPLLTVVACSSPPEPSPATASRQEPSSPEPTPESSLRRMAPADLPLLYDDGDLAELRQAVARSRLWMAARDPDQVFVFGPQRVTARELVAGFDRFLGWLKAGAGRERLAAEVAHGFEIYESVGGGDGRMLVTGYYEPVIAGSLRRTAEYQVPIYAPPPGRISVDLGLFADDLAGRKLVGRLSQGRLLPFPSRGELRRGAPLGGRVLAWARDPVDLFFVEIQGSGAVRLPDGREMRIGYAGSNGRPYRSIGRLLIDEGAIAREKMSMQAIRAYLDEHPEAIPRILDHNASVVFFRRLEGPPQGSLGFPVTAEHSVATDHRLFPRGALGFLVSEIPAMAEDGSTVAAGRLGRFVLNQDRGGAIRGPGRVDFFWGRGDEAARRAGLMKQPGRLFFLVPRGSQM